MSKKFEETKYVAVKPEGFDYYIWFKQENVTQDLGLFIGKDGWGKDGAFTNIKCKGSEIDSFIYSDELQYN